MKSNDDFSEQIVCLVRDMGIIGPGRQVRWGETEVVERVGKDAWATGRKKRKKE